VGDLEYWLAPTEGFKGVVTVREMTLVTGRQHQTASAALSIRVDRAHIRDRWLEKVG
jgi:hypothetical protein